MNTAAHASRTVTQLLDDRVALNEPVSTPVYPPGYEQIAALGYLTLAAGREGEGKSLILQDISIKAAVQHGTRTLIIDVENTPQIVAERTHKLAPIDSSPSTASTGNDSDLPACITENVITLCPKHFDIHENFEEFQEAIRLYNPDVIILDSLASLSINFTRTNYVKALLGSLREVAQRAQVAIIIIHHTTKSGTTYRGSQTIGAICEMIYFFQRHPKDPIKSRRYIKCIKNRLAPEPDDIWLSIASEASHLTEPTTGAPVGFLQIDPAESFDEELNVKLTARDVITNEVIHTLVHSASPSMTLTELATSLNVDPKNGTLRRVLNALTQSLQVVRITTSNSTKPGASQTIKYALTERTGEL